MSRQTISESAPLLLGSASPRRRDILSGLGIPLLVRPANVPEETRAGECVEDFLERVVLDKLRGALELARGTSFGAALAADTIVRVDNEVLGKPIDIQDALRSLLRISGRTHIVTTRYALADAEGRILAARSVHSEVVLRAATRDELSAYAATGEGLDKAGAYAAQGIGAFLVREIRGSYTNVVGLPACEVVEDLTSAGLLGPFPSGGLAVERLSGF